MDKFELLESYLDGDLSRKEKIYFEELLRNDPELQKEHQLRKDINDAISECDVMDLRASLSKVMEAKANKQSSKVRKIVISTSVAASIILLFAIGFNLFNPFGISSSQEIYNNYYSKYLAVCTNRSTIDIGLNSFYTRTAFEAYQNNKYDLAKQNFELVLQEDTTNMMLIFYLGICNMELGKYEEAELLFLDLVKDENHLFWEQSYWYLSLNYMAQDKKKEAKFYLIQIENQRMCRYNEAKKILKLLN